MRIMMVVAWLAFALTGAARMQAGMTAEVYSAGTSEMEVFVQTVRGIVGPEATVVPDPKQHRVVVMTTPENHAQIRALSERLTLPPRNIRIEVAFRRSGDEGRSEAGISGGGQVIIRDDGEVQGSAVLRPRLRHTRTERRSSAVQTLVVASGREAMLRVGESVPYPEWFESYGPGGGVIRERVQWQDVGSFLAVKAVALGEGDQIRVELTPVLSGHSGGQPHQVRFAEVTTAVTVTAGQTIQIGSLTGGSEFYRRFLVGVDRGHSAEQLDIELTPTLLDAGGRTQF